MCVCVFSQVFNHICYDAWSHPWKCLHKARVFFNYLDPRQQYVEKKQLQKVVFRDAKTDLFLVGMPKDYLKML